VTTSPSSRTLLAVDGNSLGHRAFHGVRGEPAGRGGSRQVTGVVVSMLASVWLHGPYDTVAVAFDHPDNRRRELDPDYKANRPETDPALRAALDRLREDLWACGFAVLEHDGAEADDVLAALADGCQERGWRCDLLSSDRDLIALVGGGTRLLRPRATFSDLVVEDEAAVREAYGIDPWQYTELAALRGDPSDGLDGAEGIGPRLAARLLRDHGSIAAIYACLSDLPMRLETSLRRAREQVERNLMLMAPLPNLAVDLEAVLAHGVDPERVRSQLADLDLEPAARRFVRAATSPPPAPVPPPPDEPPPPDDPRTDGGGLPPTAPTSDRFAQGTAAPAPGPLHGEQPSLF